MLLATLAVAGCTGGGGQASAPSVSASAGAGASSGAVATPSETPIGPSTPLIDAPSPESSPAPSTAGSLTLSSLPVPKGWKTVAEKGGQDSGFIGNGTPARARSAAHAAFEMMSVGCSEVDRSAWTDPTDALEVGLAQGTQSGVAEAMVFATEDQAKQWFALFQKQLRACTTSSMPKVTVTTATPTQYTGRRTFSAGQDWSEVGAVTGRTVRLYLLLDPKKQFGQPAQQELLGRLAKA